MTTTTTQTTTKATSFNWKLFWILLGMTLFGMLALTPYSLAMSGQSLDAVSPIQLAIQFVTQLIPMVLMIGLGLLMGKKLGLGAPLLDNWTNGISNKENKKSFPKAIGLGILVSILIMVVDIFIFNPFVQKQLAGADVSQTASAGPTAWQGFLASFYGGITEEIMMRLFLMTLLVWLGSKMFRKNEGQPTAGIVWGAIILSTIAFGLGHLPAIISMGISLTPLFVIRALVLNSAGIAFGWLYWKYGLEHAMVSHFITDIVLHVIGVLFLGAL